MKGKHYNRCWLIHEAFAERVEQLYTDSMNNPPSLNVNNPSEVLNKLNNGEGGFNWQVLDDILLAS